MYKLILFKEPKMYLCRVLFFIKLQASAGNFIERETLAQVFSCEFCEILKNSFFTEHLWATGSAAACYESNLQS